MTHPIRLDRGESPWPPLVPGGEGLNRYPDPPHALRRRMAELYGVPATSLLPVPGARFALDFARRTLPDLNELTHLHGIEFRDNPSIEPAYTTDPARAAVVDLSAAYGLAGAPCGAIIAHPDNIARLEATLPPDTLATPVVRLAEAALHPSRMLATQARVAAIKAERERMREALGCPASQDNRLIIDNADPAAFVRFGLAVEWLAPTTARVTIGLPHENDLVLAAMGKTVAPAPSRAATVTRDTRETRIVAQIDLDRPNPIRIQTGIGYWDHMLEQVAAHGGFSLQLAVHGDLHIDPHHTIEDSALALGQALRQALGDRAGIGRYGFTVPMDEALAQLSLDLGGRPFARFEGEFAATHIGAYPTQLTPHVFRSIADSLGAAIHVTVRGEDDHHKTEAAFKALGRALRQAIRVEGEGIPSTKGMIA